MNAENIGNNGEKENWKRVYWIWLFVPRSLFAVFFLKNFKKICLPQFIFLQNDSKK